MPEIKEVAIFEVRIPIKYWDPGHRIRQTHFAYSDLIKKLKIMRSWSVKLVRMEYEDGRIKSGPPRDKADAGDVAYAGLNPDQKTRS